MRSLAKRYFGFGLLPEVLKRRLVALLVDGHGVAASILKPKWTDDSSSAGGIPYGDLAAVQ